MHRPRAEAPVALAAVALGAPHRAALACVRGARIARTAAGVTA